MDEAIVYLAMSGDIIHHGHINIINEASKLGKVIVGLHTDEVIASYWRIPILDYNQRKCIVQNIKGVYDVIEQDTLNQVPNILKIKPNYIIHGDDWVKGSQRELRDEVIAVLNQWNGQLIEVKYTEGISLDRLDEALNTLGTTSDMRRKKLRKLINIKKHLRVLEAHNGLTGLIVEKTKKLENGNLKEFDAMWISSLCDSTSKGKPDIELVDVTSRLNTINEILEVTTKPIIVDGDTGGKIEHFIYTVRSLERVGVSAIIIEDKIGLKKNSLFGTEVEQTQDSYDNFCKKIKAGKESQITEEFMIIARIESLILKQGMEDALNRAKAYINAGADGIMIHSIDKSGDEILEFCKHYSNFSNKVPLVVVPTSYNQIYEKQLYDVGVNIVIYANHLIRSGYLAMLNTANTILEKGRSFECDKDCISIKEVLTLIDNK